MVGETRTVLSPLLEHAAERRGASIEGGLEGVPGAASSSGYAYDGPTSQEGSLMDTLVMDEDWSVLGGTMPGVGARMRNRSYSESFVMGAINSNKLERPIGWAAICFITYFNVSGGPWGAEEVVSSAGPLPGLVGVGVFAVAWALPMILVTAELSSAYPDDGGYSIWVAEAFGPFWGFQEAYWSWVSGVIDTAIYPVLAFDTAVKILDLPNREDGRLGWAEAYLVKLVLALLFALPNLCASNVFGRWMGALAGFVVLPFAVQCVYVSIVREKDFGLLKEVRSDPDWGNLLSVLYWNFSGFDAVSTCAGEVRNPGRNYLRGLMAALGLIVATYVFPLAIFTSANLPPWETWEEGSFSEIAQHEVGHWLAMWIVAASFAANLGMYTAEVFEDSWQLCGMARTGLMPAVFGRRYGQDGPPYVAILFALFVICCLIALDFESIVVITNLFSCLSAVLELLAFLKLRMVEPHLPRPFRVPVQGISALAGLLLVPLSLAGFIIVNSVVSSGLSAAINLAALVVGVGIYFYMHTQGHIQYLYSGRSGRPR